MFLLFVWIILQISNACIYCTANYIFWRIYLWSVWGLFKYECCRYNKWLILEFFLPLSWLQTCISLLLGYPIYNSKITTFQKPWRKNQFTGHKISFTELLSIAFHDKPIDLDISDEIESNNLKSEPTDSESSKKVLWLKLFTVPNKWS